MLLCYEAELQRGARSYLEERGQLVRAVDAADDAWQRDGWIPLAGSHRHSKGCSSLGGIGPG